MNILWIEDFGAGLDSGKNTLSSLFGNLLSFDEWDNDDLDILEEPEALEQFCFQQNSRDTIYLCRNYFDYEIFKQKNHLLNKIDTVIIDVRLDNGDHVDLEADIPSAYTDKRKFHENGGFYIFNDLIHLGITAEKMCFMTAETSSVTGFEQKCTEIYMPKVTAFEKGDVGFKKLRTWLEQQQSDYVILRRGIIEACLFLKEYLKKDEQLIQFRAFIKQADHEIATTEIVNYLDTVMQFLPLKESDNPEILNMQYRLFLRMLAHAWEDNFDANSFKKKHGDQLEHIHDVYTFGWLMKIIRNWVSHANLLEPLNAQFIAFAVLSNMRAMFKLPKDIQHYELILLNCLNDNPVEIINLDKLRPDIKYAIEDIEGILRADKPLAFDKNINTLYRQNTGNPDAEEHDYQRLLFQYFWVNQKAYVNALISKSNQFLPTLARHIYKRSFLEN